MRSPLLRRLGLTAVLAAVLAVFGFSTLASADPAPAALTFSTDSATTTPGGSVKLSMTLTNNKTYDVLFVYQTIDPTWLTTQRPDLKYSFAGCSLAAADGSTTSCAGTGPTNLGTNYGTTIPPGQSRTVTLTLQVAANSGCNGNIGFYSYFYAEFSDGTNSNGGPVYTPETRVLCS
ncbi:hypothetical protein [Streptomyces sp. SUK 48]|uniref:hypothetical protein n=1 Tax=Streptomyces sp. SUK 48 TaxID=2582831 RepID=UPI00129AB3DF|nr:hypothetical protein [Streptomyces sp. SUK 48]